ncbi:hypothetical protein AABB24_013880 [Solanum stoloniferum]|uniref:Calcineurin B-like protein n=1 Tax=Solanum stoloniferum TaxID=62892 RepID=A0ABD2TX68_9SOLN
MMALLAGEEFQLGLFRDNRKHSLFSDRVCQLLHSSFYYVAFKLYDIWQTGFIGREEVKELIFGLLYESELILTDDIVEVIINQTIEESHSKGDGKIDIEEWINFVAHNPSLLKNMTISYLKRYHSCISYFVVNTQKNDEIYKDF